MLPLTSQSPALVRPPPLLTSPPACTGIRLMAINYILEGSDAAVLGGGLSQACYVSISLDKENDRDQTRCWREPSAFPHHRHRPGASASLYSSGDRAEATVVASDQRPEGLLPCIFSPTLILSFSSTGGGKTEGGRRKVRE